MAKLEERQSERWLTEGSDRGEQQGITELEGRG